MVVEAVPTQKRREATNSTTAQILQLRVLLCGGRLVEGPREEAATAASLGSGRLVLLVLVTGVCGGGVGGDGAAGVVRRTRGALHMAGGTIGTTTTTTSAVIALPLLGVPVPVLSSATVANCVVT